MLLDFHEEDTILMHEMLHAKSWMAVLSGEHNNALQGIMSGPLFKPDDLWLDEVNAYGHDAAWALIRLQRRIGTDTSVDTARWKQVLDDCLGDRPPLIDITEAENLWRSVCRKLLIRTWHLDPAIDLLSKEVPDNTIFLQTRLGVRWDEIRFGQNIGLWPASSVAHSRLFADKTLEKLISIRGYTAKALEAMKEIAKSPFVRNKVAGLRIECDPDLARVLEGSDAATTCSR